MDFENILSLLGASPNATKDLLEETIDQYKPLIYSIINKIFESYKDFANNDDYFETKAKVKKQMLEAYLGVGFSREEAMTFILGAEVQKDNMLKQMQQVFSKINNSKS